MKETWIDPWLDTLVKEGYFETKEFAKEAIVYSVKRLVDELDMDVEFLNTITGTETLKFPMKTIHDVHPLLMNSVLNDHLEKRHDEVAESKGRQKKYNKKISAENVTREAKTSKPFDAGQFKQKMVDDGLVEDTDYAEEACCIIAHFVTVFTDYSFKEILEKMGASLPLKTLDDVEYIIGNLLTSTAFELAHDAYMEKYYKRPKKYDRSITVQKVV